MTDTPKVPETPETPAVDEIVEVIFQDRYGLVIVAFIAGALIVAGIVYLIGTRMQEGNTDAAD